VGLKMPSEVFFQTILPLPQKGWPPLVYIMIFVFEKSKKLPLFKKVDN
jgi:hypothetical protein